MVGLGFGSPLPPLEILKIEKKDNKSTKSIKGFHTDAIATGACVDRGFEFSEAGERLSDDEIDGLQEQRKADGGT